MISEMGSCLLILTPNIGGIQDFCPDQYQPEVSAASSMLLSASATVSVRSFYHLSLPQLLMTLECLLYVFKHIVKFKIKSATAEILHKKCQFNQKVVPK